MTGTSGAKQEGAAQPKRPQKAEEGVPTHRTGTSGEEQAAGAATPRTGASEYKWRLDAPDWIARGGPSSRNRRPPDWSIRGPAAVDAPLTGTYGAEQAAGATGSTEEATRMSPLRCSEAEWRTRPGRSGENKMRTRPR